MTKCRLSFTLGVCLTLVTIGAIADPITLRLPAKGTTLQPPDRKVTSVYPEVVESLDLWRAGDNDQAIANLKEFHPNVPLAEKSYYYSRLGYIYFYAERFEEAKFNFQQVLNPAYNASAYDLCDTKVRLGNLEFLIGSNDSGIAHFADLASGKIAADYDTAVEAALRVGKMLELERDAGEALSVYEQLVDQVEEDDIKAFALFQAAALSCEMWKGEHNQEFAKTPGGSRAEYLDQAKAYCNQIDALNDTPPQVAIMRDLLRVEMAEWEGDYDACTALGESFMSNWLGHEPMAKSLTNRSRFWTISNAPERQILTASSFMATAYYKKGDYAKSQEISDAILRGERGSRDAAFSRHSPYTRAEQLQVAIAHKSGEQEAADTLAQQNLGKSAADVVRFLDNISY
jgi:tetratricopeptide (TPR) repeat protein